MRGAWQWRNASFLRSLGQGLAPAELATAARGTFDLIEAGGRPVSTVTAGQELVLSGWALAGSATPFQVAVAIDGRPPSSSTTR